MYQCPQLMSLDCSDCKKWLSDLKSGEVKKDRRGQKIPRPATGRGSVPPCEESSTACKKGHWKEPKGLSEKNWQAYIHWLKCKATGIFPDDEIVKDHCMLFEVQHRNSGITEDEE